MSVAADASGTARLLDWRIDFDRPDGRVAVSMEVHEDHTNRHGNMHGGLIATVLDTAMGATASFVRGDAGKIPFSTISMTVNFIAPMPMGTITATGRIMGGGYKTVFVEGEAHDQNGTLIAQSTGTFKRAPIDAP
jgi:acyl-coenzyme A thioesterase 13